MTSTDFSKLLASLGGTLSARALGGPQAAQRFLEGANQQEEARLQRNYDASQQSRQRLFQLTRDRMQVDAKKEADAFAQGKLDERQREALDHAEKLQNRSLENSNAQLEAKNNFTRLTSEAQHAHEEAMALQAQIFAIERGEIAKDQTIDLEKLRQRHALALQESNNAAQALEALKGRKFQGQQNLYNRVLDAGKTLFNAWFASDQARQADQRARDESKRGREHDKSMEAQRQEGRVEVEQMRLDAIGKKDREAGMQTARNSFFALVNGTQAARDEASAMIFRMLPNLGVPDGNGGIELPEIDWNNPKPTIQLIYDAQEAGGFASQVVTDRVEEKTREEQSLADMTGGSVAYTTQTDYLKTAQRFNSSKRVLDAAGTHVQGLSQNLETFGTTTFDSLDQANNALDGIAGQIVASGNRVQQLQGDFGEFLGEGAGLSSQYQLLTNNQTGVSNALYQASQKVASDFIGGWTYETAEENPLFYRTPAGDFKYAEEFDRLNNGEAMKKKSAEQDQTMKDIVALKSAHLGKDFANLTPAQKELRQNLIDYQTENGNLSAQAINRHAMRLMQEGKEDEARGLLTMMSDAAKMKGGLSAVQQRVAQGVEQAQSTAAMREFGFSVKNSLGIDIVPDDAAAEAFRGKHGIEDPQTGEMRPPVTDAEVQRSLSSWMQAEGSDVVVDRIADSLVGDPNSTPMSQGTRMLDSVLAQANLQQDPQVRRALMDKMRKRFGTPEAAEIFSTAEAATELHSQGAFPQVQAVVEGKMSSSRQMMMPEQRATLDNNYVTSVFGDTAADMFEGRSRDEVVSEFFRRSTEDRPAFTQPTAGFWDTSPVGGGLLNRSKYKDADAQSMELPARVRAELGDSADFRDVHDLHMDLDPQYQRMMQQPGLLWVQGASGAKEYTVGDQSLRVQYLSRERNPDDEVVQMLDKLDYFRGRELDAINRHGGRLSQGELTILAQEQAHYRDMTVQDAIAAFGPDGRGVRFGDIGMAAADPNIAEQATQDVVQDPWDVMDVDGVILRTSLAQDEVINNPEGPLFLYDLQAGPGTLIGPLGETVRTKEIERLQKIARNAEAIKIVRGSEVRRTAISRIAREVKPADVTTKEGLANLATKKLVKLTGVDQEMMAMSYSAVDATLEEIQGADTYLDAFGSFWDLVEYGAGTAAEQKTTVNIVGTTKQEHRNLLLKAVRLGFGNVRDEVKLISTELQRRNRMGELAYEKMSGRVRDGISKQEFEAMTRQIDDFRDPEQIRPLSFMLWLNYNRRQK